GCSMGSVVGGIFAAGNLVPYKEWMLSLSRAKVLGLMDFTIEKQGFLKGEKVFEEIKELFEMPLMENFPIPFTAVATDLNAKQEVHYSTGDFYEAIRASIAIPGVFTPVKRGNQLLVDGAVLNPLPLNLVQRDEDSIIIAVNTYGPESTLFNSGKVDEDEIGIVRDLRAWMTRRGHPRNKKKSTQINHYNSIQDILYNSYRLTRDRLIELMLTNYPPDIYINIPSNASSTFDFHKTASLVEIGRLECKKALR
ncbi:MAG: patatin-like phospholipase family protein, partial [Bacteroidales bacterium]|nr:patatin-like phospholipase family protein [Bacteroidales bacterium]